MDIKPRKNSLDDGYLLHWYEIKKVIGRGGFGITYLAHDTNLDRDVAIKEFMPEEFASREENNTVHPKTGEQEKLYSWGLDRFIAEARTLAKFNHPNIVRVLSVFEENNTAYMVMEYAVGRDLSKVFKKEEKFSEDRLLDTFIPILDGLSLVHNAGFIHRDIKPANIYLCNNNSPLLLDFGSARQSIGSKTKALTSLVTFGYAPYEQYNEGSGKQGPWTDIYSLGASIYFGITGKKPIDALFRGGSFLEKGLDTYEPVSISAKGEYSENFLLSIDKALMFKIDERPRNIMIWADMLLGKTEAPALPEYMLHPPEPEDVTEISWSDTELGYNTEISRGTESGTMGLVDAHGKRTVNKNNSDTFSNTSPSVANPTGQTSGVISGHRGAVGDDQATVIRGHTGGQGNLTNTSSRTNDLKDNDFSNEGVVGSEIKEQKKWLPLALIAILAISAVIISVWWFAGSSPDNNLVEAEPSENQKGPQVNTVDSLLKLAEQSFEQKKYTHPINDNAYYYYQQVLKQQTTNKAAIYGIKDIENQLVILAKSAYDNKQYENAQTYLTQLKNTNSESLDAKFLQDQLNTINVKNKQINLWLDEAEAYFESNKLVSPTNKNAYATYSEILNLQPDNARALDGVASIRKHFKSQFNKHISKSQFVKAGYDIRAMKKVLVSASEINRMQEMLNNKKKVKPIAVVKPVRKPPPKAVRVTTKAQPKKLNIGKVSQVIGEFKSVFEAQNKNKLIKMSNLVQGRTQFIDQLFKQYKSFKIKVSNLQFIAKDNKASANIEIIDLIDKKGKKIDASAVPGHWNKFDIVVRYNNKKQRKVYW